MTDEHADGTRVATAAVRSQPVVERAASDGDGVSRRLLEALAHTVGGFVRPQAIVAGRLREKAQACRAMEAPLYAVLLECAARDVLAGGPCWRVLKGHERDPRGSALALRLLGSVHRLVLDGRAPELAPFFPTAGGCRPPDEAVEPFLRVVEERVVELRRMILDPVQTNEVGRCAAILGGFLLVARETGLPLRLLEVGASAGLNLRWDRYRYVSATTSWGDRESPVRLDWDLSGNWPCADVSPTIVERRGCDLAPVNPDDEEARLRLMSHVSPYHLSRLHTLEKALELATREPVAIDRASAAAWLASRLQEPASGAATVVFHTIVTQFMTRAERQRVQRAIEAAGRRATRVAPIAWLRMEGSKPMKDVLLTMWPGGEERRIAQAGLYGRPVLWLANNP